MMISWYKNLYVGDTAKKKERKIRHKIEQGKLVPEIYVITYASNPENQLDIFPASLLKQKAFRGMCPKIVGIAGDYGEAVELVANLADKVYRKEKYTSIRKYLEERES